MRIAWGLILLCSAMVACDDDRSSDETPEPDPEPTPVTAPAIVEARVFDGAGALVHQDVYQYIDGHLGAIDRYDPEGRTAAVFVWTRDTDGATERVTVSAGQTALFTDQYRFFDGALGAIDRYDPDGATARVLLVDYGEGERIRSVEAIDGPDRLHLDVYDGQGGAVSRITRFGPTGGVVASMGVESGAEGEPLRIEAATVDGLRYVVEVDYDPQTRVSVPPISAPLVYALDDRDGRPLAGLDDPAE